jgi:hypothetical protein
MGWRVWYKYFFSKKHLHRLQDLQFKIRRNIMKYFPQIKPTVGSRLHEAPEQIVNEEERLRSLIESHKVMAQDKAGRLFSPLTESRVRELSRKSNQADEIL